MVVTSRFDPLLTYFFVFLVVVVFKLILLLSRTGQETPCQKKKILQRLLFFLLFSAPRLQTSHDHQKKKRERQYVWSVFLIRVVVENKNIFEGRKRKTDVMSKCWRIQDHTVLILPCGVLL